MDLFLESLLLLPLFEELNILAELLFLGVILGVPLVFSELADLVVFKCYVMLFILFLHCVNDWECLDWNVMKVADQL
jgi:hypothetical protein